MASFGGWIDSEIGEIQEQFPAAIQQIQHLIFATKRAQKDGNINAVQDLVALTKWTAENASKPNKNQHRKEQHHVKEN